MPAQLRFSKKEMIWLAGNTFYGRKQIFEPDFLAWLAHFQLPDYELSRKEGQYELTFAGRWCETTMWEIPALGIINELRSRSAMRGIGQFTLDVLYARAKARMWDKVERLKQYPGSADFRFRHAQAPFLPVAALVRARAEGRHRRRPLPASSNVLLAMDSDLEAVGTNAHELPMVRRHWPTAMPNLADAPYKMLEDWEKLYGGNLLIVLPDAFGTAAFLRNAPDWVADWTGFRPDSAPPIEGGEKIIELVAGNMAAIPKEKLLIFSDALDVDTIIETYKHFDGRVRMSFGWGTNLTNDFNGCAPIDMMGLHPISIVCKAQRPMDDRPSSCPTIPNKATGDPAEVERYKKFFGTEDFYRDRSQGLNQACLAGNEMSRLQFTVRCQNSATTWS